MATPRRVSSRWISGTLLCWEWRSAPTRARTSRPNSGQGQGALGLGAVGQAVQRARVAVAAADLQAQAGDALQGGQGAAAVVVGVERAGAARAGRPGRAQFLLCGRAGPGCCPGHRVSSSLFACSPPFYALPRCPVAFTILVFFPG